MSKKEFRNWLWQEIDSRGMSQRDLSKKAKIKISPGAISHVLNGNRDPGPEFCRAIASALNYPPEYVFRKAGLLPDEKESDPQLAEANQLLSELPKEYQKQALQLIRFLHDTHVPPNTKKAESTSN